MSDVSHLDLFAASTRVRRAAIDDDMDRLHIELQRLQSALVAHVHDEHEAVVHITGPTRSIVTDGQRRLLALIEQLLTVTDDGSDCSCLVRAAEVEAALRLQAKLETAVLRRGGQPPAGSSPAERR